MLTTKIGLFAGPGAGKSILAAEIFAKLKWKGYSAELALEYAKTLVYENNLNTLDNQIYVFANQHHITQRLLGKVQFIVTDNPYLLGCVYDKSNSPYLKDLIVDEYKKLNTINFFLERDEPTFETNGRLHDLNQAKEIDSTILNLLKDNNIEYTRIKSIPENVELILGIILKKVDPVNLRATIGT
jgi:hypothetical protein